MRLITFFYLSNSTFTLSLTLTELGKRKEGLAGFIGPALVIFGVSFPWPQQLLKAFCGRSVLLILLLASEYSSATPTRPFLPSTASP